MKLFEGLKILVHSQQALLLKKLAFYPHPINEGSTIFLCEGSTILSWWSWLVLVAKKCNKSSA